VRGLPPLRPAGIAKRKPSGITRGFVADFFGASPVASALDVRFGRNPDRTASVYRKGKRQAHSVTFSYDPTTLVSVTWSNDLTGCMFEDALPQTPQENRRRMARRHPKRFDFA
jgi:hypothetical protein